MPAWPPVRRRWCPDACRWHRAAPRANSATTVQKAIRATPPAGTRTRRRSANIGSSTAPTVLERRRPSSTATALPTSLPRPRKRARSVSISTSPIASPSTTARWAAHSSASPGLRRRRVARMAPAAARYSVCTNSLEKAWCAASASGGASAISAKEVSSMSRGSRPALAIETRRTSASSSGDTTTSSVVVRTPSCRTNSARSSANITS